uniref:Cytochrome P450 51 n=1 Tax=Ganoderma boninense TaxID=34458 RepID=A0A5K1K5A5_9APHY|nr:Cytochrome P450 51 [Ganoderma boninense]
MDNNDERMVDDPSSPEAVRNQAQAAKWRKLMEKKPPKDSLRRTLIPKRGQTPPLYRYGFPYTQQYALDYARRHHLKLKLIDEDIDAFGGREELDFADVDDTWLQERDSWVFAMGVSRSLMLRDLSQRCGFSLDAGRPFSLEWDGIISLWSNYTIEERYMACPDHEEVLRVLEEAMNEVEGHNSKVQWWFDWNNDLGAI